MALIKMKPTSPGTRFVVKIDKSHLWKGGPYEPLTTKQKKHAGRNNQGRITTRHQGGGSRQKYRIIDWKRDKDGVQGVVEDALGDVGGEGAFSVVLGHGSWEEARAPRRRARTGHFGTPPGVVQGG